MSARIQIFDLCKQYKLGSHVGGRRTFYRFLWDSIRPTVSSAEDHVFYSLCDINLTINSGEIVGIVGRNGSGKSTLLRIITGITSPTVGECITNGKIVSLLEVGVGFYPELSGRENIFIIGAILGMTRSEVHCRYEEIVSFSGLNVEHLNTPVMRYSSGQYMRLAFSISVHVDADIVLVDEILAVGDKEFQRAAIDELRRITRSGKTVIFVSHQHHLIADLCDRIIWMESGKVKGDGPAREVLYSYLTPHMGNDDDFSNLKLLPVECDDRVSGGKEVHGERTFYSTLEVCEAAMEYTIVVKLSRTGNWFGDLLIENSRKQGVTKNSNVRYSVSIPGILATGSYRLEFLCEHQGLVVSSTDHVFVVGDVSERDIRLESLSPILDNVISIKGQGS